MEKVKLVLDTSLFVNPDVRHHFGETPTEAFRNFLKMAAENSHVELFMPPSVYRELMDFVDEKEIESKLLLRMKQKPPKKYELMVPAAVLYELVEDMRERVNKGLRIGEKAVRKMLGAPNPKEDESEIVSDLRRKYKEALRVGIIDSKEDVDLLLLALELDAAVVTADEGILMWAEKLGVRIYEAKRLKDRIRLED